MKDFKLFGIGIVYLLPILIFMATFLFYPIIKTFYFSFFNVGPGGSIIESVGVQNYIDLFLSEEFIKSLIVTFLFVLYTVPLEMIVSFLLALLAVEKIKGESIFRTIFASTLGVSVAAGSTIFLFLYHPTMGVFNNLLNFIGFNSINWLNDTNWALLAVAVPSIWLHLGINFIIMYGGLKNINKELYESAEIDGAGYIHKTFKITIPMLSPTIFFLLIIGVINSFETFGVIDILTSGGPIGSTNVIVYSIFQEAFGYGNFGYASSQAVILFLIMLIVTIFQFKFGEKKVHYQ